MVLWLVWNVFLLEMRASTLANECSFPRFFFNVRNVYRQILQSLCFLYLLLFQFVFSIFLIKSLNSSDFLLFDFSNLLLISAVLSSFTAFPPSVNPLSINYTPLTLRFRLRHECLSSHYPCIICLTILWFGFSLNIATFGNPLQNFHSFL